MEQGTFRVSKTQPCFHPKQHFLWLAAFSVEIFPVAHLPGFIIFSPYLCSRRTVLKMCFCTSFLLVFNSGCKTTVFCVIHRYAKYSSLRNQKRVVRDASLCPVLPFIYGHSALIFENLSFVTDFFRNFAVNYLKRYKHGKERKSNKGKVY